MSDKESKENCSGDYPAVWRFTYDFDQDIMRSGQGDGEVHKVGQRRHTAYYDVVAVTPELAQAVYDKRFGWKFRKPVQPKDRDDANYDKHELKSGPDFLCYVDEFISVSR